MRYIRAWSFPYRVRGTEYAEAFPVGVLRAVCRGDADNYNAYRLALGMHIATRASREVMLIQVMLRGGRRLYLTAFPEDTNLFTRVKN